MALPSPVPGLCSLPAELTTEIYHHLLITDSNIPIKIHYCHTFEAPPPESRSSQSSSKPAEWPQLRLHPSILRTCRRIHHEAKHILYDRNTFTLPPWPVGHEEEKTKEEATVRTTRSVHSAGIAEFRRGNRHQRSPCPKHVHLPPLSRLRKLYAPSGLRSYLLTQGLLHRFSPGNARLAPQWKPLPLTQVTEITLGFECVEHRSQRDHLMRVAGLWLGLDGTRLMELLGEWYARGGLKVTILPGGLRRAMLRPFRRAAREKGASGVEALREVGDGEEEPLKALQNSEMSMCNVALCFEPLPTRDGDASDESP